MSTTDGCTQLIKETALFKSKNTPNPCFSSSRLQPGRRSTDVTVSTWTWRRAPDQSNNQDIELLQSLCKVDFVDNEAFLLYDKKIFRLNPNSIGVKCFLILWGGGQICPFLFSALKKTFKIDWYVILTCFL